MATWIINGADRETGKDKTLRLDAETEESAVKEAGQRGILVSKVTKATDKIRRPEPPVDGAVPSQVPSRPNVPDYQEIIHGNRLLRFSANVLFGFGWVGVIFAALGIIIALSRYFGSGSTDDRVGGLIDGLEVFGIGLGYAIPCFVVGIMLRMYGALSIAVRDIARNSFGR